MSFKKIKHKLYFTVSMYGADLFNSNFKYIGFIVDEILPIREGSLVWLKWGVNIDGQDMYELTTCTKIGGGNIHYFDNSMCFGGHEVIGNVVVATTNKWLNHKHDLPFIEHTSLKDIKPTIYETDYIQISVDYQDANFWERAKVRELHQSSLPPFDTPELFVLPNKDHPISFTVVEPEEPMI